jgi:DNA invertase Pin-like site-specific DNA recombinase
MTEEGLEQEFNSLQAQREACEAYIESQRQEGWLLLSKAYDDGGVSGGTLARPALQQLLKDIEARKIDVVVVYKVDRLTRSLADFAKIVETFDRHGVSFVSVTQQFNTTSSMGRLTLNVLLSFAQFEREVTGERIRDKFLASRQKGLWMGGHPPLGYDLKERKLYVNAAEANLIPLHSHTARPTPRRGRRQQAAHQPSRYRLRRHAFLHRRPLQDPRQSHLPRPSGP